MTLFTNDRTKSREMFRAAWKKHKSRVPMEPLEKQIAAVVEEHPEYHALMTANEDALQTDFTSDNGIENPYLHMGMHLALREQVGTDRPKGIAMITRSLLLKHGDGHQVEHLMMECLGEMLWLSQRNKELPNEKLYLEALKALL